MDLHELSALKTLHHAYIVVGSSNSAHEVRAVLEKRGVQTAGNPDFYPVSVSEFNVDAAREVSLFATLKPIGEAKYVLVSFSRATTEAQNALLKVIEESPGNTFFFFCVESIGHVLPTVKSRCVEVHAVREKETEGDEEARAFLKSTYATRLSMVEKMTSAITKTQNRAPARSLVRALMSAIDGAPPSALRDLLDADRYLRMQGGSAKLVLSHLAITLPKRS